MTAANGGKQLEYTGERMVPEVCDRDTVWEHVYRYRFALGYARGRDAIDVACGEGYGTASLAAGGARSVIGFDYDEGAVRHARGRYGVDARVADAAALPLPAASADVVVSFETIEHLPSPSRFVAECRRVLRPGGTLIVSTPNVEVFNPDRDPGHNPFHCSEMTETEFVELLRPAFPRVEVFSQHVVRAGRWSLRALSANPSPWGRVKGYGRLRRFARPFDPPAEQQVRSDPVAAVTAADGWLGRLTNPYLVRPRRPAAAETPTYLICVARAAH